MAVLIRTHKNSYMIFLRTRQDASSACAIVKLNVGRIQHDTHRLAETRGWKVSSEHSTYHAAITVGTCNCAPDHADVGSINSFRRLVNVGHAFA